MLPCAKNCGNKASMKRPKTGEAVCQNCFYAAFEDEVHDTIVKNNLFKPGDYVAVAASGGKDSTVLAYIMKLLNERHNYGLKLILLSVDEGITGYRDDSLETVKRNEIQYNIPLKICSYKELYGWTMDEIVREVGRKNNCTFCGVFRRQALDRGAMLLEVDKIVTGHNADDVAETILMNLLRGDVARLQRCSNITTGTEGALPRCKPFKYTYEKEIVMYAYYKKLDYFSTECIYSPNAYRGHVRTLIKDLERIKPSSIVDIIHSGEALSIREGVKMPTQGVCKRCKYISSQDLCKACVLLEGLNKGLPKLGIGKSSKVKEQLAIINGDSIKQSKRQSKKSLAKARLVADKSAPPDLPEIYNERDGDDGEEEFDFFGCGGGTDLLQSLNMDDDEEEDDDIRHTGDPGDIENLGQLAGRLLMARNKAPTEVFMGWKKVKGFFHF
ncbi:Cytoplasmic tRNA 2-thiolation protein 1 [Orchesella cincta]|uniref:Cytoplasmic tRNA 2-thiolation protein 1 n=1 Tax=Orchesella cincta TaxID=48709 RepID=A0A1D2N2M7_ORCCI|nr:Cytoplasmic tRNA 2-thiolation protein 1 [Orchesella cincta]